MADEQLIVQMVLSLMFLLTVKHFVVDFVLQTDKMVQEKGIYGAWGGIYHSLGHGAFTYLALAWLDPVDAILPALLDMIVHYHVDWAKMNINRHYGYTPQHHQFWLWLGIDQLLHYLTYIAIIAWFCGAY